MFFKVIIAPWCDNPSLTSFKTAFPFAQNFNTFSDFITTTDIPSGFYNLENESSWINILDPDDIFSVTYVKDYHRFSIVLNNRNGTYPMISDTNSVLILLDKDYIEKFEEFIKLEPGTLTSEALKREIEDKEK